MGPRPTARTNTKAQISWSNPRIPSNIRRVKKRKTRAGMTLRAPRKPNGNEIANASMLPRKAIATVSSMDRSNSAWSHPAKSVQSTISRTMTHSCPRPLKTLSNSNSQCR